MYRLYTFCFHKPCSDPSRSLMGSRIPVENGWTKLNSSTYKSSLGIITTIAWIKNVYVRITFNHETILELARIV